MQAYTTVEMIKDALTAGRFSALTGGDNALAQKAAEEANGQAQAALGTRYALPLALPYSKAVSHHATVYAKFWLLDRAGQISDNDLKVWQATIDWFRDVARGTIALGSVPSVESAMPAFTNRTRKYGRDDMEKL